MGYFSITVQIKGRKRALQGVRHYPNISAESVRQLAYRELMKFYVRTDIQKIDITELGESSPQVRAYLNKKMTR